MTYYFLENFEKYDSEWLEMDYKHNFIQCNILTRLDFRLQEDLMMT